MGKKTVSHKIYSKFIASIFNRINNIVSSEKYKKYTYEWEAIKVETIYNNNKSLSLTFKEPLKLEIVQIIGSGTRSWFYMAFPELLKLSEPWFL